MKRSTYLPDLQSFQSGLPQGTSKLNPESSNGRTRRERDKQARRAVRVRNRSIADREKKTFKG
jgi:hypothetical protein